MTDYQKVVAIDGPSGSGKSTIAKQVADKFQFLYVDTGAMFRALSVHFSDLGFDLKSDSSDDLIKKELSIFHFEYGRSPQCLVAINGKDLTQRIREHHVSQLASMLSKKSYIREYLLNFQREIAANRPCVMEGRDIGTVVFPFAFCKIFLTATPQIRAQRRLLQLQEKGDTKLRYEEVYADVVSRDESDMNRPVAPLRQSEDAVLLDTSSLNQEQVIASIAEIVKRRGLETGAC